MIPRFITRVVIGATLSLPAWVLVWSFGMNPILGGAIIILAGIGYDISMQIQRNLRLIAD